MIVSAYLLQLRLLALRQLLAGVDDHRQSRAKRSSCLTFSSSSKPLISGSLRSSTMQSNCCSSSASSASSLEPTAVTSTSSPPPISSTIALPLVVVVLDDQQALDVAVDERADRAERLVERLPSRPASRGTRPRPRVSALLPAVAARDDVHRDVPRRRDAASGGRARVQPSMHRQVDVEDDRVGLVLVREREAGSPRSATMPLKPRSRAMSSSVAREARRRPRRSARRGRPAGSSSRSSRTSLGQQQRRVELRPSTRRLAGVPPSPSAPTSSHELARSPSARPVSRGW